MYFFQIKYPMNYKIDIQDFLPVNRIGSENNAVTFLRYDTDSEILEKFKMLKKNLLNINGWNVNSGKNPTKFFLYKENLDDKSFLAEENDLVKIKIPAPANKLGRGFDWVKILKIQEIERNDFQAILIQMKPHSCPESKGKGIAHFYTDDATSTFILAKENKTIQLSVHGRNEIPNTKNIGFINALRNYFVANGGIFGGSKIQWQHFAKEFVKN